MLLLLDLLEFIDRPLKMLINRLWERILNLMEFLEFGLCFENCILVSNLARVREYVTLGKTKEIIQLGNPVGHVHRLAIHRLQLGEVEISRDDQVESLDSIEPYTRLR